MVVIAAPGTHRCHLRVPGTHCICLYGRLRMVASAMYFWLNWIELRPSDAVWLLCQAIIETKTVLACRLHSFVCTVHHLIIIIVQIIWRHWTYKMPVRYILSSVWVRLSILSLLTIIQSVGLYVFSLSISLVMIEKIYMLCLFIIIKSDVWTITHCLGLGHETMVSGVCLSIFLLIYWPVVNWALKPYTHIKFG